MDVRNLQNKEINDIIEKIYPFIIRTIKSQPLNYGQYIRICKEHEIQPKQVLLSSFKSMQTWVGRSNLSWSINHSNGEKSWDSCWKAEFKGIDVDPYSINQYMTVIIGMLFNVVTSYINNNIFIRDYYYIKNELNYNKKINLYGTN